MRIAAEGWGEGWVLRPSPARRHWMDQSTYAYQCLPLVMANQWGWQVLCPADVRVTWDGSPDRQGVSVEVDPKYAAVIKSQFGSGIVTFSPPWLFRTSPGWDLYAKGPGNRWKANAAPLEGVIETWWLNYTFTLNWKIIEPGTVCVREGGEPRPARPGPARHLPRGVGRRGPDRRRARGGRRAGRWKDERQKPADQPVSTHHLYRKAEEIEGHLVKVSVPPVVPSRGDGPRSGGLRD